MAGWDVLAAINHWPPAIEHHARRHPSTTHHREDAVLFNYSIYANQGIACVWASPACQGHSEAAQPARALREALAVEHDVLRASAFAVVNAVLAIRPPTFVVENVRQFVEWTYPPQDLSTFTNKNDAHADARKRARATGITTKVIARQLDDGKVWVVQRTFAPGLLYQRWLDMLREAGYHITEQILTASRWGVPQRRARLFIVGHRDAPLEIEDPGADEPTLEPVLDFDAGSWTPFAKKKGPARERLEHAHRLFSGGRCWGWHTSYQASWARPLQEPSTTITTCNQNYVIEGRRYRLWTMPEIEQVMGFTPGYFDGVPRTNAITMAGNAVVPAVAAGILSCIRSTL
jgi:site-specific DNA-cytosine methylase